MASIEELKALMAKATPGPYRAHDHNDMARLGEDPEKWIGYAWIGRITKDSTPDGRFDAGWLDRDSRDDGSSAYRERASTDAHFVAAALNALPDLLAKAERVAELEEALRNIMRSYNAFDPDDWIDAETKARAVLAKATGTAQEEGTNP